MKKILWTGIVAMSVLLVSCGEKIPSEPAGNSVQESVESGKGSAEKKESKILISNMSDEASRKEVGEALKRFLKVENVDHFLDIVEEYNDTVENTSLEAAFQPKESPVYDEAKMQELWAAKKGDFIGTNCRLNTFLLMKDNLNIPKKQADPALLFLDEDAIQTGGLFDEDETKRFQQLFSRVNTEKTKDIRIHGQKMEAFFSDFTFDENARMISVVLHDNFEGDYLFIGHVGVMTETADGVLFLEKLSFSEPYQAVKFSKKQDCFRYLYTKYEKYHDETTAKPFLMDNGNFVDPDLYGGM